MSEGEERPLKVQQRVAELETALADSMRERSEEVCSLSSEVARLRSQLEEGRAEKEKLGYQLTLAQQEGRQGCHEALAREEEWSSVKESLKGHISRLSTQCQEWRTTLDTVQQARGRERLEHQQLSSAKDEELTGLRSKCTKLAHAHKQLKAQQSRELKNTASRETTLQKNIQTAVHKGRLLEDRVVNITRSLSECRQAREACQARLREAEESLAVEKMAHGETSDSLAASRLSQERLQTTLDNELRKHTIASEEMYSQVLECQQLERELEQKQSLIADLTHKLNQHKTTSDTQLAKARERQQSMEKSHTVLIKEAESILKHFTDKIKLQDGDHTLPLSPAPSPAHFLAWLQTVLKHCEGHFLSVRSKLDEVKVQSANARQKLHKVATECLSYKELITNRTSAMEEADQRLSESAREMARLRSEVKRGVALASELRLQLAASQRKGAEELAQHRDTRAELLALRKRHSKDEEARCQYLQTLYEQLQSANLQSESHTHNNSSSHAHSTSGWGSLSTSTSTAAGALVQTLRQSQQEVEDLNVILKEHQATLELAQEQHREAVNKLTSCLQEREEMWSQRNEALNKHFQSLRSDTQAATQELEASVQASLREIEQLTSSREEVASKLCLLQESHRSHRLDRACLLSSTCLLAGALFPALDRNRQLQAEKLLLQQQLSELEGLKSQVAEIVACILSDSGHDQPSQSVTSLLSSQLSATRLHFFHPLLMFRKAAIVVLAANRMRRLHQESMFVFTATSPDGNCPPPPQLPVNISHRERKSLKKHDKPIARQSSKAFVKDLAGWLRSEHTLTDVRDSFSELQTTLDSCSAQSSGKKSNRRLEMIASMKQAFSGCLAKLVPLYPPTRFSLSDQTTASAAVSQLLPGSLWRRLGQGLAAVVKAGQAAPLSPYISSTELGEVLHTQLVNLVGRLHDGELARQALTSQLCQTSLECGKLSAVRQEVVELQGRVKSLQEELSGMVPGEQLKAVHSTLEASLQREREATSALSALSSELLQQQASLLSASAQLQSQERALKQAKAAATAATNASACVSELLQCAHTAFTQSKKQLALINQAATTSSSSSSSSDPLTPQPSADTPQPLQLLLPQASPTQRLIEQAIEEFTRQRPAAELASPPSSGALEVVRSFLDAHQSALSCIATLHRQAAISEEHTLTLKQELGAACRRELMAAALPPSPHP